MGAYMMVQKKQEESSTRSPDFSDKNWSFFLKCQCIQTQRVDLCFSSRFFVKHLDPFPTFSPQVVKDVVGYSALLGACQKRWREAGDGWRGY